MERTALFNHHAQAGAKWVDFAGWEMPIHYGSQMQEHQAVRQHAGMFDVSHMGVLDIEGKEAQAFLRYMLANDVAKLQIGQALYSCLLNEKAGVIDDLIAYRLSQNQFRLILNAARREPDMAWLKQHARKYAVTLMPRPDLGILALQGPQAASLLSSIGSEIEIAPAQNLKPFHAIFLRREWFIARTGYTGEDGFELVIPAAELPTLWSQLLEAGVQPCGLGARDTLRLEAGLNLYGADMDETTHPYESNLGWTVDWQDKERQFLGKEALTTLREHPSRQLTGLVLLQPGVLRNHQRVTLPEGGEGEITSGSFSPLLKRAIALARLPISDQNRCWVDIRGQAVPAQIVAPPFVRRGKILVNIPMKSQDRES